MCLHASFPRLINSALNCVIVSKILLSSKFLDSYASMLGYLMGYFMGSKLIERIISLLLHPFVYSSCLPFQRLIYRGYQDIKCLGEHIFPGIILFTT